MKINKAVSGEVGLEGPPLVPIDPFKDGEDLESLELLEPEVLEEEIIEDEESLQVSSLVNPFINSIFPVLFINRDLRILYANQACKNLFTAFSITVGSHFVDVFGRSFTLEDVRNIRETVLTGKNGYSWKGMSRIKSRNMTTVESRVYINAAELTSLGSPKEFVVMFDDVTEENRQLLRAVFMSLLEASKLKDNDTGKHISRVNFYSRRLAEELYEKPGYPSVDADFIDNIGFLASMHDVGKIGTPDDILNKEGPLSDWEWTVMQEHTKNGAFILSTYPNPMAKEISLSHHEKWASGGYPFQLEGDMIPLSARIVSIADVYDALRMERSYKPAFNHSITVEKMMEAKGTQFDPGLLDIFYAIAVEFDELYERNKDRKNS
jgi:putative two-component system response regulator